MQSLGRRYVGHINRTYSRTGTLWEGRFKSIIVDSVDYVMACYRYIEANPVRTARVERAGDHLWNSYPHDAPGRSKAARRGAYAALSTGTLPAPLIEPLREATQRGWVPGRESFRHRIEAALGRKTAAPVRGRSAKRRDDHVHGRQSKCPRRCE